MANKSFAALLLLAGTVAAQYADYSDLGYMHGERGHHYDSRYYADEVDQNSEAHYQHSENSHGLYAPPPRHYRHDAEPVYVSPEARHLTNLMGMDSNAITSPEYSNSLDEMAAAMMQRNAEYIENDLQDSDIPTYRVVHSGDSDDQGTPLSLKQGRPNQTAPPAPAPSTPAASSSSSDSSSTESSEESKSSESSESSSSSSEEEKKAANEIAELPFRASDAGRSTYAREFTSSEDSSSSELTSSEDTSESEMFDEVNFTVPRKKSDPEPAKKQPSTQDTPKKTDKKPDSKPDKKNPFDKKRSSKRKEEAPPERVRPEYREKEELEKQLEMGAFGGHDTDETLYVPYDEHYDVVDPFYEFEHDVETPYDHEKFTDADLAQIRAIKEHLVPVKDRKAVHERIAQEDVFTLTHSLDFAEQQLQDRLRHNLEMYHDLQKLKKKPHGEFTTQDLMFVKQTVCPDG